MIARTHIETGLSEGFLFVCFNFLLNGMHFSWYDMELGIHKEIGFLCIISFSPSKKVILITFSCFSKAKFHLLMYSLKILIF